MRGKKKKHTGRMAVLTAGLMITAGLAAGCGKSGEAETTAQKEFVYVPEFMTLENENGYVDQFNVIGDTIYYISNTYDETSQISTSYLCSLKAGEKDAVRTALDLGEDTSVTKMITAPDGNLKLILSTSVYAEAEAEAEDTPDAEGEAEVEDTPAAEEEAEVEDTPAAEGEAEAEDDTSAADESEDDEDTSSGAVSYIGGSASGTSITTTADDSSMDYQEPISQKTEVCTMSPEGEVVSLVEISDNFKDMESPYVQYAQIDKDGNIYAALEQVILVLDKDGKKLFDIKVDNWVSNMFTTKDGVVMVTSYGANQMEVRQVDLQKKALGDPITGMMISTYGNYTFAQGYDSDILFSVDNRLYSYNLSDEAPTEILNWIDCDINENDLRAFGVLEDGRILAITSSNEEETPVEELVYLTRKKGSEVPEKKILTYATLSLGYDTRKQIIDFNKTSQEYRIETKEYMTDDWTTGVNQLNTDIVSGNGPDIIDLTNGIMKKYAVKGILEDLYPYIDEDPELNREDYLANVLKAYELDGKLYGITGSFSVLSVAAKAADVGERTSISVDEIIEMMQKLPEGAELYDSATKASVLSECLIADMDKYVNWSTGECQLNGDEFIKVLEFANTFDMDYNYDEDQPSAPSRIHDGTLLMLTSSVSSTQEYQMTKGMFGEPITYIGFPTSKENGSFLTDTGCTYGINSKSKNKDGAWQFIRSGITKEAQETFPQNNWGFPIMKSALELKFKEDMTDDYYEMPDGTKEKQPKTSWGYDDFNMEIYAATEEEVTVVRNLLESVDTLYQYDTEISNIITEEATAFFEGQKTAKDVADIIQSRVQIYVNENR